MPQQPPSSSFSEAFQRAKETAVGSGVEPLTQYQRDPIGYAEKELGIPRHTIIWSLNEGYDAHTWDGDVDPVARMFTALANNEDVGVESATSTGKSFGAAVLLLWFVACWRNARCFTFAPKEDQLRLYIWMELRKLFPMFQRRFPSAELTDLCLRVRGGQDDSWAAHGYSVGIKAGEQVSSKAAGMHAADMLLIYEETQGIDQAVIEAGANTSTAPHNRRLFLGNPDNQLDTLHRACHSAGVTAVRVSALDHPNVVTGREIVPGAVSRESIGRRATEYGVEDRIYLSRVRGISPAESADALIKLEWIIASQNRHAKSIAGDQPLRRFGLPAIGVDVANSESGDEAAIAMGYGHVCVSVNSFPCPDANRLGWRVVKLMESESAMSQHVGVDTVGVGAGCFNEMARLQKYVKALNGGAGAEVDISGQEVFMNLRAQMWWRAREDLRLGTVDIPIDPELATDLVTPTWESRNGKILVESKEKIKERTKGGRSPNKGDAFVYWNFVRDRSPVASAVNQELRVVAGDPLFNNPSQDPHSPTNPDEHREWVPGSVSSIGQGF